MVKVTDADREAAERSALAMGGKFTCFDCTDRLAEVIAHARIAGAKAGLEKAAKAAEQYDDKRSLMTGVGLAVHAIRNIDPEECE